MTINRRWTRIRKRSVGVAVGALLVCSKALLAEGTQNQVTQFDLSAILVSSQLVLKFMAVKPTTTTPSNMDQSALDRWFATGGPLFSVESNDPAVALPIAKTIAGWRLRQSRRRPAELDLRYRLEIMVDGKVELLLHISVGGELLHEGRVYNVVDKGKWLRKLWFRMLPPAYSP